MSPLHYYLYSNSTATMCTIITKHNGSIDNVNTLVGQTSSCDEDDRQTNKQTGQSN